MLASTTIDTPLIVVPGMSDAEIDELWIQTYRRAKMTQSFLDGEIDVETYFDFMAEQGFEPSDLMDAAEENLEFAINQGIVLEI